MGRKVLEIKIKRRESPSKREDLEKIKDDFLLGMVNSGGILSLAGEYTSYLALCGYDVFYKLSSYLCK